MGETFMQVQYASLALLLVTASASATPVYLSCSVSSATETQRFSVSVDEATNKITHTGEKGSAFNADGFFSVNEISYKNVNCASGICVTNQYTINRINLAVTHLFRAEAVRKSLGLAPKDILSQGACEIVPAPERKI